MTLKDDIRNSLKVEKITIMSYISEDVKKDHFSVCRMLRKMYKWKEVQKQDILFEKFRTSAYILSDTEEKIYTNSMCIMKNREVYEKLCRQCSHYKKNCYLYSDQTAVEQPL